MRKIFILAFVALFISCQNQSSNKVNDERLKFVEDSIARENERIAQEEKHKQDSINKVIIAEKESLFKVNKDEFNEKSWVHHKSEPRYRNCNGVYCYFALKNNKAENLRFVFQYYSDDWLFIRNMIFNFDGDNIRIIPDRMQTDCGDGGMIWEWCDEHVYGGNEEYEVNEAFIKKFLSAEQVKVKLNGSQYSDTRTLTKAQIKAIKDTYEYYVALGGEF